MFQLYKVEKTIVQCISTLVMCNNVKYGGKKFLRCFCNFYSLKFNIFLRFQSFHHCIIWTASIAFLLHLYINSLVNVLWVIIYPFSINCMYYQYAQTVPFLVLFVVPSFIASWFCISGDKFMKLTLYQSETLKVSCKFHISVSFQMFCAELKLPGFGVVHSGLCFDCWLFLPCWLWSLMHSLLPELFLHQVYVWIYYGFPHFSAGVFLNTAPVDW
jgi:hypothetical protein